MANLLQRLTETSLLRGNFVLRSGEKSSTYLNVKELYGDPHLLNEMADRLWNAMNCEADCVIGFGEGGKPLATTISSRYGIKLSIVRRGSKEHGTGRQIEAYKPQPGDKVIIPDDVFTTGSGLIEATNIIESTGATVVKYGVVVNREESEPSILRAPLVYLFTMNQILELSRR